MSVFDAQYGNKENLDVSKDLDEKIEPMKLSSLIFSLMKLFPDTAEEISVPSEEQVISFIQVSRIFCCLIAF
jgi:hypothetical protein